MVGIEIIDLATHLVHFVRTVALAASDRNVILIIRYRSSEIESRDEKESYFTGSCGSECLVHQKVNIVVFATSWVGRHKYRLNLRSRFAVWELRRIVGKIE